MTVASNWVGEGKDPLLRHSPDGDILARIIKVLQQRVDLGLFTIFIKIRAHRGEFLNEKADRWADEGRDDVKNERWGGPSSRPTFSWTEAGVVHRCSMNKTLRARVNAKVAELQIPLHDNFTSFSTGRTTVGKFWENTGRIRQSPTDPRGGYYKVSANNFHVPNFSSCGGFGMTTVAGSAKGYTRKRRPGRKASATSKPDALHL